MKLQPRDRRALLLLGVALLAAAVYSFRPSPDVEVVQAGAVSIPMAERRLARLREIAATLPARRAARDTIMGQLKTREKGLIEAETAAQAQAQLSQIVRKITRSQSPPVEVGQVDLGSIQPLGKDYGETSVSFSMNCRIEQLVNLLADISAQPEAIATQDLRVLTGDPKQKLLNVRLTVSGVLPRRLVPERKGATFF